MITLNIITIILGITLLVLYDKIKKRALFCLEVNTHIFADFAT